MEFIDTHAHLYLNQFESDIEAVIQAARNNHVSKVLLPNIDSGSIDGLLRLKTKFLDYFEVMMGVHPCSIDYNYLKELKIAEAQFLGQGFVSVGEIGLDYYWDTKYKAEQIKAFRTQINWAKDLKLPIAVHCREAFDDILNIIDEEQDGRLRGVLHCFTGNVDQAKQLIDNGFLLGVGGVITYRNSGLDKTITEIDLNHLVLETDAPYLSPVPYRGKRNQSAYLMYIAEKLAEVKDCALADLAMITTANAKALFNLQ
jgi:TatD DNase family protein